MASKLEGIPTEVVEAELEAGSISMQVDEAIYPLDALYGASYIFVDRCYVLLDRPAPGRYRVTLTVKKGENDEAALRALLGEFANELLSCAWRYRITQENQADIEATATLAIGGAMGAPSLDDLASFDFTDEKFDDPLGIALSWEEKYKKKDEPETAAEAPATKPAEPAPAPAPEASPESSAALDIARSWEQKAEGAAEKPAEAAGA